jgi:hypothetical protein
LSSWGIKLRRYLGSVQVRRGQRCAEFARDEAAVCDRRGRTNCFVARLIRMRPRPNCMESRGSR